MIGWGTNFRSRVSAVGSRAQVFWFWFGFRITPHLHLCLITRT
jgi:hypothetical protein